MYTLLNNSSNNNYNKNNIENRKILLTKKQQNNIYMSVKKILKSRKNLYGFFLTLDGS